MTHETFNTSPYPAGDDISPEERAANAAAYADILAEILPSGESLALLPDWPGNPSGYTEHYKTPEA